jgi:hypothetical protein
VHKDSKNTSSRDYKQESRLAFVKQVSAVIVFAVKTGLPSAYDPIPLGTLRAPNPPLPKLAA